MQRTIRQFRVVRDKRNAVDVIYATDADGVLWAMTLPDSWWIDGEGGREWCRLPSLPAVEVPRDDA